jgi:colanic acid/amylovoran biosynthesis glycosyltransferase
MKVAYLTTCFGTQSHTFMRREIRALRALHLDLELYGVRQDTHFQAPDAVDLVGDTHYLYPLSLKTFVISNAQMLGRRPIHYFRGLLRNLWQPEFSWARKLKLCAHFMLAAPFAKQMKNNGVTHIHAQFLNVSASIAMFAAHHSGLPFSITVHSAGSYGAKDTLGLPQKLAQAQFLIMISQYNVTHYDQVAPCREKSFVIRCGMDIDHFHFVPPQTKYSAHRNFQTQPLQLLAVARFVPKKGLPYLISAVNELQKAGVSAHLTLIGSGPLEKELKAQVSYLGLQDRVSFTGALATEKVESYMSQADIVVVPSMTTDQGDMEGLPVVIMEAMACGTYVIATEHAGIPEIVIPGVTGLLCKEKDTIGLCDAIICFLNDASPSTPNA